MSLLLDALERADKERGQQLFTPTSHPTPATAVANEFRIKRWVIIEVIIGSLLLGLVSYILFFRSSSEVSDPVTGTNTIETLPKSESFMPAASPNQKIQQTEVAQPLIIQIERSTKSLASTEPVATSQSDSNVSKLYQQQLYQQQDSREVVAEKETIKSTPPATGVVANNAVVVDQNLVDSKEAFFQQVPLLSDLPTNFKRRVPSLKYTTHVYSKDIKAGFVNINGPFREVGSQLAPGLTLIAILPDAAILELDGVLFRLRALNDWVGY